MRTTHKRLLSLFLLLCLSLTLLTFAPARSEAADGWPIPVVRVQTNYTPIALMDLDTLTVEATTDNCRVTKTAWYTAGGAPLSDRFDTDPVYLEVELSTSGGYSFDGDAAVYINNTAATVVSNTGTSLTARSHEYTPDASRTSGGERRRQRHLHRLRALCRRLRVVLAAPGRE